MKKYIIGSFAVVVLAISVPFFSSASGIPSCTLSPYATSTPVNTPDNIEFHMTNANSGTFYIQNPNGSLWSMGGTIPFPNGTITVTPTTTTTYLLKMTTLFGTGTCTTTIATY